MEVEKEMERETTVAEPDKRLGNKEESTNELFLVGKEGKEKVDTKKEDKILDIPKRKRNEKRKQEENIISEKEIPWKEDVGRIDTTKKNEKKRFKWED